MFNRSLLSEEGLSLNPFSGFFDDWHTTYYPLIFPALYKMLAGSKNHVGLLEYCLIIPALWKIGWHKNPIEDDVSGFLSVYRESAKQFLVTVFQLFVGLPLLVCLLACVFYFPAVVAAICVKSLAAILTAHVGVMMRTYYLRRQVLDLPLVSADVDIHSAISTYYFQVLLPVNYDGLKCSISFVIMHDPVCAEGCRCNPDAENRPSYERASIARWMAGNNDACPTCRTPIENLTPNVGLKAQITQFLETTKP